MREKRALQAISKAADIFDIPGEAAGIPRVTATGTGRVHIENHRGLLEYGRNVISVNAGQMVIKVSGEELELLAMSDMELVITGKVSSIEFSL